MKSVKSKFEVQSVGFIMFCFAAGAIFGSLVGAFSLTEDIPAIVSGYTLKTMPGGVYAFLNGSKFHIFALICATSTLGVATIPALVAVRGYLLSCTAAAIYVGYPGGKGLLINAVVIGLPALITLPCLIIMASDSLTQSRKLLSLSLGNPPDTSRSVPIISRSMVGLFFIAIAALAEEMLMPMLIANIF